MAKIESCLMQHMLRFSTVSCSGYAGYAGYAEIHLEVQFSADGVCSTSSIAIWFSADAFVL